MSVEELKQLQKELKEIHQPLNAFLKLNFTKPETLGDAQTILKKLPSSDSLGRALQEWQSKTQRVIEKDQESRKASFNVLFTQFMRTVQEQNIPYREFDQSWRIGPLELQLRRERSQIQMAYNQRMVMKWSTVAQAEDIQKLYDTATKKLSDSAIPLEDLQDIFWDAYYFCRYKQIQSKNPTPALVPLKSFCQECTLAFLRLSSKERKKEGKNFPDWAFLYNLDLYREKAGQVPIEKRLGLQTGSQVQTKTMGMETGGLHPQQDYRTYCFIYAVENQR